MIPEKIEVFDNSGKKIRLIFTGKSGGEGAIYAIEGEPDNCAKIFFKTGISEELHEKILTMVKYPPGGGLTKPADEISSSSIAWPSSPLYMADNGKRRFVGYAMPKIDTGMFRESHMYYDPGDRLKMLGGSFSWQYLMTAAYNISFVVSKIHEIGHCVGDFSPRNILIARTAAVSFIDCDSFQVSNPETGRTFYTKVGTGELLPPELMGKNFRKEEITRHNSDLFALGIVIFRLLMNGAHPYQAAGKDVWDLPTIEQKTLRGIYPYVPQKGKDIRPPRYAPAYGIVPPCIRDLFSECFVKGHGDPLKRPSADDWCRCLADEIRKLKRCNTNPNHWYGGHLKECPWCELSRRGGKDLFPYTKTKIKTGENRQIAHSASGPAQIKSCLIQCDPRHFSFRTDSGTTVKGKIEVEISGCKDGKLSVGRDAAWITDIRKTGESGNKKTFEFVIEPSKIPNKKEGIRYRANILLRAASETKKVPVEIGFSLRPLCEPESQKIILRGIDLKNPTDILFSVKNAGEGTLTGTAETDREWLKISPESFSAGDRQEFRIKILPEKSRKSLIHGNLIFKTNGGNLKVPLFASETLSCS
ncbi:helix-hairpin-helix domain-containing protein [Methanolacinia paynteri]|uniref:helix-hairpin-helix domain-containing protein n=1 Tax=Methanolacinia paynteri TaxID=230356 RepID=UPI00064FF809|nr:protein kinase [Methanolacinia paynteri]